MKRFLPALWTIAALYGAIVLFSTVNSVNPPRTVASKMGEEIIVHIKADGRIFYNGEPLSEEQFVTGLKAIYNADPDREITLRGDAKTDFEDMLRILDLIKKAGPTNIAFAVAGPAV